MSGVRKLDYIDAARGIAVLGVVLVHCRYFGRQDYPGLLSNVLDSGPMGVQLFFVVSAFTLFLSMQVRNQRAPEPLRNFFLRRFFRIAPMYYLGIGFFLFLQILDGRHVSGWVILSNFLFLHGFNPYDMRWTGTLVPGGWSIAVEMQFYLLVPFLFQRIRTLERAVNFLLLTILLNVVLRCALLQLHPLDDQGGWLNYLDCYLPAQLPVFACGIVAYFLITTPVADWRVNPKLVPGVVLFVLFNLVTGKAYYTYLLPPYLLFSLAFVGLLYMLSTVHIPFLVNPISRYLGRISFSMYLLHFAVLYWLQKSHLTNFIEGTSHLARTGNFTVRFLLVLTLSTVASSITYYLVEKLFQQLGNRLIKRVKATSVAPAIYS